MATARLIWIWQGFNKFPKILKRYQVVLLIYLIEHLPDQKLLSYSVSKPIARLHRVKKIIIAGSYCSSRLLEAKTGKTKTEKVSGSPSRIYNRTPT